MSDRSAEPSGWVITQCQWVERLAGIVVSGKNSPDIWNSATAGFPSKGVIDGTVLEKIVSTVCRSSRQRFFRT